MAVALVMKVLQTKQVVLVKKQQQLLGMIRTARGAVQQQEPMPEATAEASKLQLLVL
jgi:hypothetical protein